MIATTEKGAECVQQPFSPGRSRSIAGLASAFGRRSPQALGSAVDDLASQVADDAYFEIKDRFLADAPELAQAIVTAATDPVTQMVQNLLNDASTQALLGEQHAQFQSDVENGVLPVVAAGVVLTLLGTFLIVRFSGS